MNISENSIKVVEEGLGLERDEAIKTIRFQIHAIMEESDSMSRQDAAKLAEAQIQGWEASNQAVHYEKQATKDKLTGLNNRNGFNNLVNINFERFRRAMQSFEQGEGDRPYPLSVMMFDIDHFKAYNDNFGHNIGDIALKIFSEILRTNIRKTDGLARFGGEEFVLLAEGKDITFLAEKLRKAIEENLLLEMSKNEEVQIATGNKGDQNETLTVLESKLDGSVSIGIDVIDSVKQIDAGIKAAIDKADKALYEAKNGEIETKGLSKEERARVATRNRVAVYNESANTNLKEGEDPVIVVIGGDRSQTAKREGISFDEKPTVEQENIAANLKAPEETAAQKVARLELEKKGKELELEKARRELEEEQRRTG